MDDVLWTLDELVEVVTTVLSDGYDGAPNGRVRGVPDRRAVRWYTTVGLVDRPCAMRGRTALYGWRHLLQLVAVKRRQAAGHSLADIQAELAGATDATLRDIARVPPALVPARRPEPGDAPTVRRRFWAEPPMPATPAPVAVRRRRTGVPTGAGESGEQDAAGDRPVRRSAGTAKLREADGTRASGTAVHGLLLPGGATLVLPAGAPVPDDDDLAALRAAARPLLEELAHRGLAADPDQSADPGRHVDPDRAVEAPTAESPQTTDLDQLGGTR